MRYGVGVLGTLRGSPSRPSWYCKLATHLPFDKMQGFQ